MLEHMKDTPTIAKLPGQPAPDCCAPQDEALLIPGSLAPERAERLAEQLKALADATRLRMVDLLAQQAQPLCVCDITAQFAQHQPTISHHLRILRDAGLVMAEKRGIWAYYQVTTAGRRALAQVLPLD